MTAVTPDLLRLLVREVVQEVLAEVLRDGLLAGPAPAAPHPAVPTVVMPRSSRTVAGNGGRVVRGPGRRIDRGAVTERVVRDAARDGVRLVLGPRAVLTPLGRDLSRTLGVDVEHLTYDKEL